MTGCHFQLFPIAPPCLLPKGKPKTFSLKANWTVLFLCPSPPWNLPCLKKIPRFRHVYTCLGLSGGLVAHSFHPSPALCSNCVGLMVDGLPLLPSPLPFPKPLVSVLPNPPDLPSLLLQGCLPGEVFPGHASKTGPLPGTPWPSSLVYFSS